MSGRSSEKLGEIVLNCRKSFRIAGTKLQVDPECQEGGYCV